MPRGKEPPDRGREGGLCPRGHAVVTRGSRPGADQLRHLAPVGVRRKDEQVAVPRPGERPPDRVDLGVGVDDLLGRAFDGSASQLAAHLLDQSQPTSEELSEIRKTIQQYVKQQGKKP